MARTGRPSDLTPDTVKRITDAILGGADRYHAAVRGGVHRSTLSRWLSRGKKQRQGEFRDFYDAIRGAEAERIVQNAAVVTMAGRGRPARIDPQTGVVLMPAQEPDWKAAAWLLERLDRKRYGKQVRTTLANDKENPVTFFSLDIPKPGDTPTSDDA